MTSTEAIAETPMAPCPAHDDCEPSLSIMDGEGGKVLMHCHAACDQHEVIAAFPELVHRIDPHLRARLPGRLTDQAGGPGGPDFLFDQWLIDVALDRIGKVIAIMMAMTLIKRAVLHLRKTVPPHHPPPRAET